jgi:hypothetical protein
MTEQTLAGQSPDSTYGEAQHPTFKKERRVSEQAIILVICQDWVLLSSWRGSYCCSADNLYEVTTILGPCVTVPVGFNCYYY